MGAVDDVRRALPPAAREALGVLVWGSHATGRAYDASDIDVCVVAGDAPATVDRAALELGGRLGPRYDVKLFEHLPLYLQAEVIEHGILVASRDERTLWEYFRTFRKVWEDQSVRRHGPDELARLLEARKRSRA